jgi:hypothetical protein
MEVSFEISKPIQLTVEVKEVKEYCVKFCMCLHATDMWA